MTFPRFRSPRFAALFTLVGIMSLALSACGGGGVQYDPAGQNSGSPENALGTFNFPVNGTEIGRAHV